MLASENGCFVNVESLRSRYFADRTEVLVNELINVASEFELRLKVRDLVWQDLLDGRFDGPLLLVLKNGNVVVARGAEPGEQPRVAVSDPMFQSGAVFSVTRDQLEKSWTGLALLTAPMAAQKSGQRDFGFSWFIQKLKPSRGMVRDIFIASFSMHLATLAVPLFFQIILDKVLPNRAMTTLVTITVGVCVLLIFDAAFNYLRNLLLAFLTRRFEQSISDDLVTHLISLPIEFFNKNSSGVLLHRINEANNVKDFLASRIFNTVLDMTAVVVFMPVLALYSLPLTGIVLLVTVLAFAVLYFTGQRFNQQLKDMHAVEGRRKGYLTELIQGIATVKTLAIENFCIRRWRRLSADYAGRGLDLARTSALARAVITGFERTVPILIGAAGVVLVLDDKMTVGALIAFNMLGTRVSGPLIQCAALLQDYQKAVLSLHLVGELMQTEPESHSGELANALRGDIEFESVSFSYPNMAAPALKAVSLRLTAGQTIGVVGRSGSGKTTLTRLLQKLYLPQSGIIRIDGQDLREIETRHLRTSVGVVQQDNYFFRGTVRENIALGHPEAAMEDVVRAAEMAGADEFIELLPHGYGSLLEENAHNLSGGQRQRLAIARALIGRPTLMIFDEATSALDPESEAVVRNSLRRICRGRTTIIITHRLSFVRDADQIVVLDRGQVVAVGKHEKLLRECLMYRDLWNQQARVMS
ncbi:ABC export transporter fused inner membrane and ATPases [Microvirga aerophila]|uniref:ABC export transporter fused inner membrane and ATPases n=2 Tax=Microvirga aerophila TaxID=670291 RepID=A0A512C374_9HYPH|nr:ABC export transporter fused inner membrane and ATPases [Microvirga aerophila]